MKSEECQVVKYRPEFYGRLMKLEARLGSPPGAWLGIVLIAGSVLSCLALLTGADVPLLSDSLSEGLRSGWAYAGIVEASDHRDRRTRRFFGTFADDRASCSQRACNLADRL